MDRPSLFLFELLKGSLGCESRERVEELSPKEWSRLVDIAFDGGVAALAVDGLQALYESNPGMELCEDKALVEEVMEDTIAGGIHTHGVETFWRKCIRIARRFARIWHYRNLATESALCMIWNNFAFSSYMKRKIEM